MLIYCRNFVAGSFFLNVNPFSDLCSHYICAVSAIYGVLTLDTDFYLCHRFSLFIIRNFGDIASRPNKNYISLPAEFSEVFWHFLAAYANKNNARFQLSEDEV